MFPNDAKSIDFYDHNSDRGQFGIIIEEPLPNIEMINAFDVLGRTSPIGQYYGPKHLNKF